MGKSLSLFIFNVRRLMSDNRWSQAEFARQMDMDTGNVSRMLAGKHWPTSTTVNRIATRFGVEIRELFKEMPRKRRGTS